MPRQRRIWPLPLALRAPGAWLPPCASLDAACSRGRAQQSPRLASRGPRTRRVGAERLERAHRPCVLRRQSKSRALVAGSSGAASVQRPLFQPGPPAVALQGKDIPPSGPRGPRGQTRVMRDFGGAKSCPRHGEKENRSHNGGFCVSQSGGRKAAREGGKSGKARKTSGLWPDRRKTKEKVRKKDFLRDILRCTAILYWENTGRKIFREIYSSLRAENLQKNITENHSDRAPSWSWRRCPSGLGSTRTAAKFMSREGWAPCRRRQRRCPLDLGIQAGGFSADAPCGAANHAGGDARGIPWRSWPLLAFAKRKSPRCQKRQRRRSIQHPLMVESNAISAHDGGNCEIGHPTCVADNIGCVTT